MSHRDTDNSGMHSSVDEKSIDLENCRKLVKSYIDLVSILKSPRLPSRSLKTRVFTSQHLYSAALFWADKVVSLSNEDPKDVCTLAQCMYLMKQYHRAAHLIKRYGLEKVILITADLSRTLYLASRNVGLYIQQSTTNNPNL